MHSVALPSQRPGLLFGGFVVGREYAPRVHWILDCAMSAKDTAPSDRSDSAISSDEAAIRADIDLTLDGDHDAFRRIVKRYQSTIAAQMRRFSRDRRVIEELVHDVFVEAFVSLSGFRQRSPFEHWLRKIAVRVGYRFWTTRDREKQRSEVPRDQQLPEEIATDTYGNDLHASEASEVLHAVLSRMSPRDRLVLTLIYWDGHSVAEAARLAGWTHTMCKVQAHRARKRLKRLLEELDDESIR